VLRMTGWGAAGLLLYLALPLATKLGSDLPYTFWQLLKTNLGYQWAFLKAFPKYLVLILGLTGLLPVLAMGVRWPSTFGETSAAGVMLTGLMFRLVHGFFLAACVWVAFDPEFSPRKLGLGLPFLTFYWLGALSAGYYLGYFLVVCGKRIDRRWNLPRWWERLASTALFGAALAVAVAAPAALAWRNLPVVRAANGPELARFIGAKVAALPANGAVVLSDDPVNLTLVEAALRRDGRLQEFLLLHTRFLPLRMYHEHLRQTHPDRWPDLFAAQPKAEGLDSPALMQLLRGLAETNSVYYLHPSFGYYFENFHPEPRGLIYRLQPYPPNSTAPPALPDTIMDFNARFWERLTPELTDLEPHVARGNPNSVLLGRNYAIAANFWGVQLQRVRRLEEARQMFDLAVRLNPDNVAALINAEFNASLRRGAPTRVAIGKTVEDKFGKFRTWDAVLGANGPIDEPDFCFRLGLLFARNLQFRQSANNLLRARELDPDNPEVHIWLANTYLQGRRPDATLAVLDEFRARTKPATLGMTNQIELARLEAWAHFYLGDTNATERVWREARAKFPQSEAVLDGLAGLYMLTGRFPLALPLFTELLNLAPENPRALLNLAAIQIQLKNFEAAIELLDRLLVIRPGDRDALLNRAIARLQAGRLAEAQADYQALLAGNPSLFTVHYGLGEIAWRQTNHPAALSNYLAYLKLAPTNTDEARNVQARVQELKQKLGKK
jgi:tetratricopeptide (TPR) repeat protein